MENLAIFRAVLQTHKQMLCLWPISVLLLLIPLGGKAQQFIGLRFNSHFHRFSNAPSNNLAEGYFSTGGLGVIYCSYEAKSRLEFGLSLMHKSSNNDGFPNLPLIMQDFGDNQNVGMTTLEAHIKAGPSLGIFNPKLGYVVGYRLLASGFQRPSTREINRIYFALPIGCSFDFPTQFGSVGVGASYYWGLTSVLKTDGPGNGRGRIHSINIELTTTYEWIRKKGKKGRKRR